ncbi:MAG: glycosyltransferase [Clostridiales bacterium]|nr:glycosyltransferase [Candidatus Apopatocola equi]
MRIVQLMPNIRSGDAVSNDALLLRRILLRWDKDSRIYAVHIGEDLPAEAVRPASRLPRLTENDILIYHMSVGDEVSRLLEEQKCRKVMVFHNITPPEYFEPYSREYVDACARGYAELERLRWEFDFAICDSDFNRRELVRLGYTCPMAVCPVLIPMEDYAGECDDYTLDKYAGGRTNILFVGRLAPNKRQEDVIAAFAAYREKYDPDARLILAGSDGIKPYTMRLRDYTRSLGTPDVKLTGHIGFSSLLSLYRRASALLCMSEHEGFCVPLVEAMYFNVPIVARDAAAVGETLGGSGVLLPDADPEAAAEALHRVIADASCREELLKKQRERLSELTGPAAEERMAELIGQIAELKPRRRQRRFVQALPRLSRGDAIGDEAMALRTLMREKMGLRSDVWTEYCADPVLQGAVLLGDTAPELESEDICLYHMASGDRMCEQFLKLKCRKILLYHGLTPASFFESYSPGYAEAAEKGKKQLEKLIAATEEQWADSDFDRRELEALGAKNVKVLPLLLERERYALDGPNGSVFDDRCPNILFVGRLAPNKKIEDLLRAFACYRARWGENARLLLCGDEWAVEGYTARLKAYTRALGLENVYYLGKVSQRELAELYDCASVLLTLSEHEGFCVPLAEAMLTGVPALALDAAAMGETLGDTGGLLPDSEPETAADAIHRVLTDKDFRAALLAKQEERLKTLSPEAVGARAEQMLTELWEKRL